MSQGGSRSQSKAKVRSKSKAEARSKAKAKRDEARAHGELGRKAKLILLGERLQVLYYARRRKPARIGARMENMSKSRNRRNTENRRKN